jgi:predicted Zn-dependent protease
MKTGNKISILLPLLILILFRPAVSPAKKQPTRDIIRSAMRDELERNIARLNLEDMERPFFISYNLYDVKTVEITATLGAIVESDENRFRNHNVRLMVGGYAMNDENFQGGGSGSGSSMLRGISLPIEDDYNSIRRSLWIATDNTYKRAAELFELKKAALEQQTLIGEEARLDDFSRAPSVTRIEPPRTFPVNRKKWEKTAREISEIFQAYPDIYSSQVRIFFYQADLFFMNSEGTEVVQPLTLAAIQINAYTQAVDGEPLSDHVMFYDSVPKGLPPLREIQKAANTMVEELLTLRDAPVFDESYFGPVMLEGQAAAEFFSQRLFGGKTGLIAERKPITSTSGRMGYRRADGETLEDRIDRRILARDLTVKSLPGLEKFLGQNLLGSYSVDLEGIIPPEEIVLVENGILKTLLNNRTPTSKVRESNGHQRPVIGGNGWTSSTLGPGVISVSTSEGKSHEELKKELLSRAREEGMDYGILIRKVKPPVTGTQYTDPMVQMTMSFGGSAGTNITEPVLLYRVYVEDGREEPVRSVTLGGVSLTTLRHIAAVSEKQFVYNTLVTSNWSSGIPASVIVPHAVLLEELEVKNEKRDFTPKLPAVPSPIVGK